MFSADFMCYKNNCQPITGLEYVKLPFGPVPDQFESILNECVWENIIEYEIDFINNQIECHNISSKRKFDKTVFNNDELKILKMIKNKFEKYSSREIVEFSNKEKAFTEPKFGEKNSYDFAFCIGDLFNC